MNPLYQTPLSLKPCPAPGEGVHTWVYYAACTLVEAGYSDEDAIEIIEEMMTRDPNPPRGIEGRFSKRARRKGSPRTRVSLPKVEAALARYEIKEVGVRL